MSIDHPKAIKLTPSEKKFVRETRGRWKAGDYYMTNNYRLLVGVGVIGVSFTIWRDKYRHDGMSVIVNDWESKSASDILKETCFI